MLTDLPDDIQGVLFQHLDDDALIMLYHVNKNYYQLVSSYKKNNNIKLKCYIIARKGYLSVLKWIKENGYNWTTYTCSNAARGGHIEVLKWARENDCYWNEYTCSSAAELGLLEVLKWARENGCDWNSDTCYHAAINGHLEVLKWARENGCNWSSNTEQIVKQKWPEIFQ
jgi:hypothetical protein